MAVVLIVILYYVIQQSNVGLLNRDPSGDTSDAQKEPNEKKQRAEQHESKNSQAKQTKDDSNSGEPAKENYIHVRARRGQATNSHSLAERVRHMDLALVTEKFLSRVGILVLAMKLLVLSGEKRED